jgi:hypothetical protein
MDDVARSQQWWTETVLRPKPAPAVVDEATEFTCSMQRQTGDGRNG